MKDIASNSIFPIVVEKDAAGVYYEVPHMVVARFVVASNGIVVDANDTPIVEMFTMCCDAYKARFDQKTHLKPIDDDLVLLAGVTIHDWSQISFQDDLFVTNPIGNSSIIQRQWYRTAMDCFERVNIVQNQDDCAAKWEAN